MIFALHFVSVVYHTDCFVDIKPAFASPEKAPLPDHWHIAMSANALLNFVCKYFY